MRWKSWDIILHPHEIGDFRILCEKHSLEFTNIAFSTEKAVLYDVQFEGFTFSGIMTQRINAFGAALNSKYSHKLLIKPGFMRSNFGPETTSAREGMPFRTDDIRSI